jgi:acetyl-CoA carboxylase carboxyl transferase subunit beta
MSWLNKLLPPKIKRNDSGVARRSSCPKACGASVRPVKRALRDRSGEQLQGLSEVRASQASRVRVRASICCSTPKGASRSVPRSAGRFAVVQGQRRYPERLQDATGRQTGETDALIVMQRRDQDPAGGPGRIRVRFHGRFDGLGAWRALRARRAGRDRAKRVPFICVTASGGARMQEGLFSLMQMAKTTAILTRLTQARLPFISILTDPTMGGVSASFAFHRRCGDCRTRRPDRLCRSARHRADRPRNPARGFPAIRVPARKGRDRHDRRPPGNESARCRFADPAAEAAGIAVSSAA